jgi:proteasome lid subunit RPN8/RPN11
MDSGISFGKIERKEPRKNQRPDRDPQFSACQCGVLADQDLPVFVDLDVMREMEAHARTNTHVELGGVLLGEKSVDEDGKPFVVVRESIRAEHYEATRGSFKFTHDTWSEITRQREKFPAEYGPVGWYHTHPDWGVFLSGMDLFICENFFSDDLDVALVIDPCRGDRGWFYWKSDGNDRSTARAAGFTLFTGRHRRSELLHFAEELARPNPAYYDSRYEGPEGESNMQPVVHLHQPRNSWQELAVAGMLTIQTLVVALLAWKVFAGSGETGDGRLAESARSRVYEEMIGKLVTSGGKGEDLAQELSEMALENHGLKSSVRSQGLLISQLEENSRTLARDNSDLTTKLDASESQKNQLTDDVSDLKQQVKTLTDGKPQSGYPLMYLAAAAGVAGLIGIAGGWFAGMRSAYREEEFSDESRPRKDG